MHILDLQLATNDLDAQYAFYTNVFHFPVIRRTANSASFQVGSSRLTFNRTADGVSGSYHFAFNVPENQFEEAKQWLRQHVPLLTDSTGADEFYFDNWDAHSVYFVDPADNILELIARHTLPSTSSAPFNGQSVLEISEIGVTAEDVPAQVAALSARAGLQVYAGPGTPEFTVVGDEHGLFIVVKRGRIWFPDTGKPATPLPITVTIRTDAEPMTWNFS